jgi:hypothetical protein
VLVAIDDCDIQKVKTGCLELSYLGLVEAEDTNREWGKGRFCANALNVAHDILHFEGLIEDVPPGSLREWCRKGFDSGGCISRRASIAGCLDAIVVSNVCCA